MGGEHYSYDANGNTLSKTIDGDVVSYGYNAKNQLVSMGNLSSTSIYQYNIDGIRNQKTEDGQGTQFLIDANRAYAQVITETTATAEINYTFGDDLVSQSRNAITSYYLYDGLGSTRALTDDAGIVTDTYNYEAFGETLNKTGTTENSYLYTGEQYDESLDNYYLRARYYDPTSARFTQQDTWMGDNSDPVTLHKYLYANADPVNTIDPTGNFGLASMGAANSIRSILTDVQLDVGFNLFNGALTGESPEASDALYGLAAMGGAAAFKMMKLLSNKFRQACGNSFDEDTEVWTSSGTKLITDVLIGDKVLAYNEQTGEFELQEVTHLIQREGDYQLIEITVGNETIDATENHPFYVKGSDGWVWKEAVELEINDIVLDKANKEQIITKINTRPHQGKVFNLTVDNVHTYLVGEDGVVAHNAGGCKFPSFPSSSKNHIFKGDISPGGRITGYHHRSGGIDSGPIKLLEITTQGRGAKGGKGAVYGGFVGYIDGNGKLHRKYSTFFPNTWTSQMVIAEINTAVIRAASKGRLNGTVQEKGARGLLIEIKINGGVLESAYPVVK